MMLKFKQEFEGNWIKPRMHNYKMQCCDCGLIHEFDFIVIDEETKEIVNGYEIMFRAYRKDKKKNANTT